MTEETTEERVRRLIREEIYPILPGLVLDLLMDPGEGARDRHGARIERSFDAHIRNIAREVFNTLMEPKKYIITQDQIDQLTGVANSALQTVSDAANAVNTEIAAVPGTIQRAVDSAVKDALAAQGASTDDIPPADISGALTVLANIQGGVHNIAVAAQQAGAVAPAAPAPPVSDPATGTPVAVTTPPVSVGSGTTDASGTATAPAATAGTDGTGAPVPPDAPVKVGDTISVPGVDGDQTVTSIGADGTIETSPAQDADGADSAGKAVTPSGTTSVPGAANQPASVNPGVPAGVTDQATGGVQASTAVQAASQDASKTAGGGADPTDPGLKASGAAALDSPLGSGA